MKLSDFEIGVAFYTQLPYFKSMELYHGSATGRWMCTDIGTRSVVAYKAHDLKDSVNYVNDPAWDLQDNVIFYPHDFGGCFKVPTDLAVT